MIKQYKRRILFLIDDGFEEIETIVPLDILRRANNRLPHDVIVCSCKKTNVVVGACKTTIISDILLSEINNSNLYDAIVIPGGPHHKLLLKNKEVLKFVKLHSDKNKILAAICAGPMILDAANVLNNHSYTCYPSCVDSIKNGFKLPDHCVVSQNIITASGPGSAFLFGFKILESLYSQDVLRMVKLEMIYNG